MKKPLNFCDPTKTCSNIARVQRLARTSFVRSICITWDDWISATQPMALESHPRTHLSGHDVDGSARNG